MPIVNESCTFGNHDRIDIGSSKCHRTDAGHFVWNVDHFQFQHPANEKVSIFRRLYGSITFGLGILEKYLGGRIHTLSLTTATFPSSSIRAFSLIQGSNILILICKNTKNVRSI